jgi:hypothetical protein
MEAIVLMARMKQQINVRLHASANLVTKANSVKIKSVQHLHLVRMAHRVSMATRQATVSGIVNANSASVVHTAKLKSALAQTHV